MKLSKDDILNSVEYRPIKKRKMLLKNDRGIKKTEGIIWEKLRLKWD